MLKELAHIKPANIALASFEEYFKAVNNPNDLFFIPDEDAIFFNERYEGVSKSSCTNAITFQWHKIPYQTFVMY